MTQQNSVALLCTLDTKEEHARFVASEIRRRGHAPQIIDIGVLGNGASIASITRSQVASAAGVSLDALRSRDKRGHALTMMARGAREILLDLHRRRLIDGAIGIGGGSGTAIACSAMRALPLGFPKVMVSTMAGTAKSPEYAGGTDIVMVNSITDIIGMNFVLQRALADGAATICALVESRADRRPQQTVAKNKLSITSFGVTTKAALSLYEKLAGLDIERLVFHANGAGGRTMEQLVNAREIDAVLDLTITELADEVCGGLLSAGPERLTAAGRQGCPQVVLPGAIDMVNFGSPETVPAKYRDRQLFAHSPNTTLMRTDKEENAILGRLVAERLSAAKGRTVLILPLRGFSDYGRPGGVFESPECDEAFISAVEAHISASVFFDKVDANINDDVCIDLALRRMLELLGRGYPTNGRLHG